MNAAVFDNVMKRIDADRVTELAVRLVDVPSPTGNERGIAECIHAVFREIGIDGMLQEFEPDRFNAIGRLPGRGNGATLVFNGHMDISHTGDEPYLPQSPGYKPKAVVQDGWVYGMGVHNMKGGIAAFIAATEAVRNAGAHLKGNVTLACVGGEIERHSILDHQGPSFRGGGCGTKHFLTNGGIADMAVVGEPTRMTLVPEHVGSVGVRLTTRGMPAPARFAGQGSDAIRKMRAILDAFDEFASDFSRRHPYKDRNASVHMHSIEGGWPYRCNRVPIFCHVFLEFRTTPNQAMTELPLEVEHLIERARKHLPGLEVETEFFVSLPPCKDTGTSEIAKRVRLAHKAVMGVEPDENVGMFSSDAAHFQAYGIPTVNYGPAGRTVSGLQTWDAEIGEHVAIEDLTNTARVYAALMLDVCSKTRSELGLQGLVGARNA
jgi:acetylornithine deacetylase/succinyl-diaminopimelate desuccinylase-like protein